VPGENVGTIAHPDSSIARRAGFMTRHLWVTRYDRPSSSPPATIPTSTPAERAARVREGRPPARARRRRPLVQRGLPPRRTSRGVAGDAGRLRRLSAQARRILRGQPRPRRAGNIAQTVETAATVTSDDGAGPPTRIASAPALNRARRELDRVM
jgi:hypothetical protein